MTNTNITSGRSAEVRQAVEIFKLACKDPKHLMALGGYAEELYNYIKQLEARAREATKKEEQLRVAVDALRKADAAIFNDNGDVTYSPMGISAVVKDALQQIAVIDIRQEKDTPNA